MLGILEVFTLIFSVIGVGYVLARTKIIASDAQRLVFNKVAFFAATPALIFQVVATSQPAALISPMILTSTCAALLTAALYVACSRIWFPANWGTTVMGAASSGYVNSNTIGLPVGIYVLGNIAYMPPLLLMQITILTPIILGLITRPSKASRIRQIFAIVRQSLFTPIVLAAFAGFIVSLGQFEIPDLLLNPIELLGGASIPMVLISFGASLYSSQASHTWALDRATVTVICLKTFVMPALAFVIGFLIGLDSQQLYAVAILATLPTAHNVYNYAATYQQGVEIARDSVLITTFLALPAMLGIAGIAHLAQAF
ncbi:AEC family transporter [Corynebacterium sp. HS2168-gen11]|uniref:AEC family transporter n=1 Tax=Corynebacterium sp. HS2168-gen11 TaxID=2974027 RepID=UPI00216AF871|nr:AEC family transporter [Corynebacterium sp. HS2168-gen11]MCS4535373.1 AEC family transporter [Corynebacterium sp. HS2168-gen11]